MIHEQDTKEWLDIYYVELDMYFIGLSNNNVPKNMALTLLNIF
jgi:hypothetical protein